MCQEYFGVSPGITLHCFLIPGLLCAGWTGGGGREVGGWECVCVGGCCELRLLRWHLAAVVCFGIFISWPLISALFLNFGLNDVTGSCYALNH